MSRLIILTAVVFFLSCNKTEKAFDPSSYKNEIEKMADKFSLLAKTHKRSIIAEIYDKDARYWATDSIVLHGQEKIIEHWSSQIDFFTELKLSTNHLSGTKEFIFESGEGYARYYINNKDIEQLNFFYINVWKRQKNGQYKLYYDMFKQKK